MNREQLVDAVARLLNGDDRADRAVAWPLAQRIVDAVLPQITTVEELDALPDGCVFVDRVGDPWDPNKDPERLRLKYWGPLTVVWRPEP